MSVLLVAGTGNVLRHKQEANAGNGLQASYNRRASYINCLFFISSVKNKTKIKSESSPPPLTSSLMEAWEVEPAMVTASSEVHRLRSH